MYMGDLLANEDTGHRSKEDGIATKESKELRSGSKNFPLEQSQHRLDNGIKEHTGTKAQLPMKAASS